MEKIIIKYENREVPAIMLARFDMINDEFISLKGFFGKIKKVFVPMKHQYCLVFIPWKHREKEIAIIHVEKAITLAKLSGVDIVSVDNYVSPFTEESPYYEEYQISNFVGYQFIYHYKNYIADVRNQCFEKPLEILYKHHPELLLEEFNDE